MSVAERSPLGVQEFGAATSPSSSSSQSLAFNSPTPMRLTRRDGTGRGLDAYRETWMQIEPVYAPQPYVPPPKVERTGPQITPLYPGLPESPSKRGMSQTAGSPQHRALQAQQLQSTSPLRSPSAQNRFLKGQSQPRGYAYGHLPAYQTEVFDPALPSPTVVVHKVEKNNFNKNSNMRKHRGESRNVLGGLFTS